MEADCDDEGELSGSHGGGTHMGTLVDCWPIGSDAKNSSSRCGSRGGCPGSRGSQASRGSGRSPGSRGGSKRRASRGSRQGSRNSRGCSRGSSHGGSNDNSHQVESEATAALIEDEAIAVVKAVAREEDGLATVPPALHARFAEENCNSRASSRGEAAQDESAESRRKSFGALHDQHVLDRSCTEPAESLFGPSETEPAKKNVRAETDEADCAENDEASRRVLSKSRTEDFHLHKQWKLMKRLTPLRKSMAKSGAKAKASPKAKSAGEKRMLKKKAAEEEEKPAAEESSDGSDSSNDSGSELEKVSEASKSASELEQEEKESEASQSNKDSDSSHGGSEDSTPMLEEEVPDAPAPLEEPIDEEEEEEEEEEKAEEDANVDETGEVLPLPVMRRLCGRCSPEPLNAVLHLFPDKKRHEDLREHFRHIREDDVPIVQSHWASDYDQIHLPPMLATSEFSMKQHPKVPLLTGSEVFHLECQIHHHKVKWPAMKEAAVNPRHGPPRKRQTLHREQLEQETLRCLLKKKPKDRTFQENLLLMVFLTRRPFFRTMRDVSLTIMSSKLECKRFEEDDVIYAQGDEVTSVYIILTGTHLIKDEVPAKTPSPMPSEGDTSRCPSKQVPVDAGDRGAVRRGAMLPPMQFDQSTKPQTTTWRGAAGLGLNPNTADNNNVDPRVLGLWDVVEPYSSPPLGRRNPLHTRTVIATSIMEAVVMPARVLVNLLDDEATRERLKVLRNKFPLTAGKTDAQLSEPSCVERGGRNPSLHRLFTVSDVRRHASLWSQGDVPNDDSKVVLILEGTAHLKSNGRLVDEVGAGTLLGEEGLKGEKYHCTVFIDSPRARILFISVADFNTQFLLGNSSEFSDSVFAKFYKNESHVIDPRLKRMSLKVPMSKMKPRKPKVKSHEKKQKHEGPHEKKHEGQDGSSSEGSDSEYYCDDDDSFASWKMGGWSVRVESLRHLLGPDSSRARDDVAELMKAEWRRLMPKRLPPRVAPPGVGESHRTGKDLLGAGSPRHATKRQHQNAYRHADSVEILRQACVESGSRQRPMPGIAISSPRANAPISTELAATRRRRPRRPGRSRSPSVVHHSLEVSGAPCSTSRSPSPDREPRGIDRLGFVNITALAASPSPRKIKAEGRGWCARTVSPTATSHRRQRNSQDDSEIKVGLSASHVNFVSERMDKAFAAHQKYQEVTNKAEVALKQQQDAKSKADLLRRQWEAKLSH